MTAFRKLAAASPRDSTHHFDVRNGRLEISYDLMRSISQGNLRGTPGTPRGAAFADFLRNTHGLGMRSSGGAYGLFTPNDAYFDAPEDWALHNTGASVGGGPARAGVDVDVERVWDRFGGADTLVIAVVDAGFDFQHPDLRGRNWINQAEARGKPGIDDDGNGYVDDSLGWDFVDGDNSPDDYHGHGTYVSSVIAAHFDNHEGLAGVAPECRIMPVRVLDASGHGDPDQIAEGIRYAVRNGAKVINFSIGGDVDNPAMRSAFQAAQTAGVPVVVAAGNSALNNDSTPGFPASYPFDNMLVVAAHDAQGRLSAFSNYGKNTVHLAAPGENILVAGIPDPVAVWKEDFEGANLSAWTAQGGWNQSSTQPLQGTKSLTWSSGQNGSIVTASFLDLTGRQGGSLSFYLAYHPANTGDALVVEGNREGSSQWVEIAWIDADVAADYPLDFGLQAFDGARFKIRFRNSTSFSSAGRQLKLDGLSITAHDPHPASQSVYAVLAGTSIAAPYVTAYVGLQRLACDRMGVTWTRARALTGVVQDAYLTGTVATGGRLDIGKGLDFYLSALPSLVLSDSTHLTCRVGQKSTYTIGLSPSAPRTYAYAATGLANALIDGNGILTWTPGPQDLGVDTLTIMASGPTLLRKRIFLSVGFGSPTALSPEAFRATQVMLFGKAYRVPNEIIPGAHRLEIRFLDAAGKTKWLHRSRLTVEELRHYRAPSLPRGSWSAIWIGLDGQMLSPVAPGV